MTRLHDFGWHDTRGRRRQVRPRGTAGEPPLPCGCASLRSGASQPARAAADSTRSANRRGAMVVAAALLIALVAAPVLGLKFTATLEPIRIKANPGDVVTRHFRLTLPAGQPRTMFRARVEDFWRSEDGSQSIYRPSGTLSHSCGPWVSLDPVESVVAPGTVLDIRVTVATPADLLPGGHWCALTVDQVPDPTTEPAGVAVRFLASVSVAIFVTVEPLELGVRVTGVDFSGDAGTVLVENTGNSPVPVEGRVEFLAPGSQRVVAEAKIPQGSVMTEPSRQARLPLTLPPRETLPSGRYRVRVLLDIGLDHLIGAQKEVEVRRDGPTEARH